MKYKIKKVTKPCTTCGKPVTRIPSHMLKNAFCNMTCCSVWKKERFTKMNLELNPTRMTIETRTKVRNAKLGTGKGLTYEKTFSRHTHRVVAEQKLGRKLIKGEVVHHIDENKRNNHPDNLIVFSSQSEHAKWHIENSIKGLNKK